MTVAKAFCIANPRNGRIKEVGEVESQYPTFASFSSSTGAKRPDFQKESFSFVSLFAILCLPCVPLRVDIGNGALTSRLIRLLATPPHGCSYFADRQAVTWFVDPSPSEMDIDVGLYQALLERGFRRSGAHLYRPHCPLCQACLPLRVPVQDWRPRRQQQRAWARLAGRLTSYPLPPGFDPNHFALYRKYLDSRHGDGDMAGNGPEDYLRFLRAPWCRTRFVELRLDQELLAVAVTDYLPQGLSAVYTFFDPELERLSPGVVAILWQMQECRRLNLPYLYLGYWIADCRKMAYKQRYRPFELYINGVWERRGD